MTRACLSTLSREVRRDDERNSIYSSRGVRTSPIKYTIVKVMQLLASTGSRTERDTYERTDS